MSLVNKMLVLLFALVAISHGWKGIVAGVSYEFLEFYDIILKEDSTMTAHQHASWAQGVHMGGSNEPYIDESFGLVEMIDERSYRFITYLNTIAIIRDHPDVLSANKVPDPEWPNTYVVRLRPNAAGARGVAAWANSIHVQEQADDPDDRYKGVITEEVLSNSRWCFLGSFSSETVAEIREHPQVESVYQYNGVMFY